MSMLRADTGVGVSTEIVRFKSGAVSEIFAVRGEAAKSGAAEVVPLIAAMLILLSGSESSLLDFIFLWIFERLEKTEVGTKSVCSWLFKNSLNLRSRAFIMS